MTTEPVSDWRGRHDRAIRVFVLAQGQQRRLPSLTVPKQMLTLPACANMTIIDRTLCQLAELLDAPPTATPFSMVRSPLEVIVVCEGQLAAHLRGKSVDADALGARVRVWEDTRRSLTIVTHTLDAPGNSSLKGIDRTFGSSDRWVRGHDHRDQTIVLLGDVVYSWECLQKLVEPMAPIMFVGSHDLDPGNGELWGLTWRGEATRTMQATLEAALTRHPPYVDYQPGQMRRWLWEVDRALGDFSPDEPFRDRKRTWFQTCDDYTRDIDIPKHLELLGELGELANVDDFNHDIMWGAPK